jgi:hypothetical protein
MVLFSKNEENRIGNNRGNIEENFCLKQIVFTCDYQGGISNTGKGSQINVRFFEYKFIKGILSQDELAERPLDLSVRGAIDLIIRGVFGR